MPAARCSRSASVYRGYVHRLGKVGSTRGVDGRAVIVLVVFVVNWCASRTVVAKLGHIGGGMRTRAGVGGRVRVDSKLGGICVLGLNCS